MSHNMAPARTLRDQFLSSLRARDLSHAVQAALALLQENSRTREWAFIRKELAKIPKEELGSRPLKVALLSSFSTEFLHAPLVAYGFVNGLDIQIYQAGFSQFRQEILLSQSRLYQFAPDVIALAVEGMHWIPELYSNYLSALETGLDSAVSSVQAEIRTLLKTARTHTDAPVLLHNFSQPVYPELGILDSQAADGQSASVLKLNQWIADTCRELAGIYVLDYAGLVARAGALHWYDDRLSHMAQAPISMDVMPHLAAEYMKFFRGFTGQAKKCLVLDLDNTLWGGVLGEAGVDGIHLGPTYPGSAFMAFQRALLQLHKRGILLAIASKNNPADVDEVFRSHRNMILKKEHFASIEVHWKPKSESIRNISTRLNIGLEHIVFVDDNAVECEEVSTALPMVRAICLPVQPEKRIRAVLEEGLFDSLTYSSEDRRRTELYRQREQVDSLRGQTGSIEEFYRSLQMTIAFSPLQPPAVSRAAQLTQKTNQFNATTHRYTESDLIDRMNDPDWNVTTVTVRDRFGDNGIVGLMMARQQDNALEIDTFLLSCRVIGRSVESAMLAQLRNQAGARGLQELRGCIVPTRKNQPVREVFAKHGFIKRTEDISGTSFWVLSLSEHELREPEWIAVENVG